MGYPVQSLVPVPGVRSVGTAKKTSTLTILGRLPLPIQLTFVAAPPDCPQLPFQPVVIDGLAMDVNLSGPFLKHHGIDQIHTKNLLRFGEFDVPMRIYPKPSRRTGLQRSLPLCALSSHTIPPKVIASIPVRVAAHSRAPVLATKTQGFVRMHDKITSLQVLEGDNWQPQELNPSGHTMLTIHNQSKHSVPIVPGRQVAVFSTTNPLLGSIGPGPEAKAKDQEPRTEEEKKAWLIKQFDLDEKSPLNALNFCSGAEKEAALQLLMSFWDRFSIDGSFGRTNMITHSIHTGDHPPIKCRTRPINPALLDDLRNQIEEWIKHDVIEPSQSPWSSALVAAKKKNGKTRWCVDYRRLNDITTKDAYPLPHIEDNLSRLAGDRIFSTIDGSGAFHVVDLDKEARPKTAFSTPWGLYQFKRMPFGLCNAPATYSRLVHIALSHIPAHHALPYLDDTLIHSPTLQAHLQGLQLVLSALRRAGLKLQPSKCHLFRSQAEYLGHWVTKDGIQPLADYTKIVRQWPMPTTLTELRSFLGKVGYYRRFIADYAKKAKPLLDALITPDGCTDKSGKRKLSITPEMRKAHETLRKALCSAPVLAYPYFSPDAGPFIVDTDWSQDHGAIGGVLSQEQDGQEKVIAYGAKKLTASQRNYAATKGELFALLYFLKHWRYYLQWRPFIVRTDHRALKWIRTMEAPEGMISRWLDVLANFNFTVQYRKGEKHGNADGLSRAEHVQEIVDLEEDEEPSPPPRVCALLPQRTKQLPNSPNEWRMEQTADAVLRRLRHFVQSQEWPSREEERHLDPRLRELIDLRPFLITRNGVLGITTKEGGMLPIAPFHLEDTLILHAHHLVGHRAVQATMNILFLRVFLPSGKRKVQQVLQQCQACQRKTDVGKGQRHTYVTVGSSYPFQRISIDFVGPLPLSKNNNTVLLTVKDTFTKWLEAFPLPRATAEAVAKTLESEIFARFGYPDEIHSDQGTQFTGHLMKELAELLGIRTTVTPAYHPQSNPVERAHRDLKAGLRAALVDCPHQDWEDVLPQVLFAFRISPTSTTKLSPFELLFGKDPNIPLGALDPPTDQVLPLGEYASHLRDRITAVQEWARENLADEVHRQKRVYTGKDRSLQIGDHVWLYTPSLSAGPVGKRKLYAPWTGPWVIVAKPSAVLYTIRTQVRGKEKDATVAGDRLRLCVKQPVEVIPLPSQTSIETLEEPLDPHLTTVPRRRQLPAVSNEPVDDSDEEDDSGVATTPESVASSPFPAPSGTGTTPGALHSAPSAVASSPSPGASSSLSSSPSAEPASPRSDVSPIPRTEQGSPKSTPRPASPLSSTGATVGTRGSLSRTQSSSEGETSSPGAGAQCRPPGQGTVYPFAATTTWPTGAAASSTATRSGSRNRSRSRSPRARKEPTSLPKGDGGGRGEDGSSEPRLQGSIPRATIGTGGANRGKSRLPRRGSSAGGRSSTNPTRGRRPHGVEDDPPFRGRSPKYDPKRSVQQGAIPRRVQPPRKAAANARAALAIDLHERQLDDVLNNVIKESKALYKRQAQQPIQVPSLIMGGPTDGLLTESELAAGPSAPTLSLEELEEIERQLDEGDSGGLFEFEPAWAPSPSFSHLSGSFADDPYVNPRDAYPDSDV
jgi:transposase InsO family protein